VVFLKERLKFSRSVKISTGWREMEGGKVGFLVGKTGRLNKEKIQQLAIVTKYRF